MSDIGEDHSDYIYWEDEQREDPWSSDSFIESQYMTHVENSLRCLEELDPLQVQVDPNTLLSLAPSQDMELPTL